MAAEPGMQAVHQAEIWYRDVSVAAYVSFHCRPLFCSEVFMSVCCLQERDAQSIMSLTKEICWWIEQRPSRVACTVSIIFTLYLSYLIDGDCSHEKIISLITLCRLSCNAWKGKALPYRGICRAPYFQVRTLMCKMDEPQKILSVVFCHLFGRVCKH